MVLLSQRPRQGHSISSPDKETLRNFFEGIAPSYDRINSILSLRIDALWRRKAARLILNTAFTQPSPPGGGEGRGEGEMRILDLGVGTGKFLEEFLARRRWRVAAGVDFAPEMLRLARRHLPSECRLIQADIHDLPFEDEAFDVVVSSFTLRSVKDRPHFFREVRRILKPGRKAAFLCLTRPESWMGRALYAPYLKFYLPFVGGLISSDRRAYQFLSDSIQSFPSPARIGDELESHGFRRISVFPFTFGISTLMVAEK